MTSRMTQVFPMIDLLAGGSTLPPRKRCRTTIADPVGSVTNGTWRFELSAMTLQKPPAQYLFIYDSQSPADRSSRSAQTITSTERREWPSKSPRNPTQSHATGLRFQRWITTTREELRVVSARLNEGSHHKVFPSPQCSRRNPLTTHPWWQTEASVGGFCDRTLSPVHLPCSR